MFTSIRTSEANKQVVSTLTRKLNLGSENIIARIALSYSLAKEKQLDIGDIKDSRGKEYSKDVLFGDQIDIYAGMIALNYGIYFSDKNIPKYVKLHLDDGLEKIIDAINSNDAGLDFINREILKSSI